MLFSPTFDAGGANARPPTAVAFVEPTAVAVGDAGGTPFLCISLVNFASDFLAVLFMDLRWASQLGQYHGGGSGGFGVRPSPGPLLADLPPAASTSMQC